MAPTTPAVIFGDAHLGHAPESARDTLHAFLAWLPSLTRHAIINGDLFEFWFAYRKVVPRAAFSTLHALRSLHDRGVRLTIVGGNHDRWGGDFWETEMGAVYQPREAIVDVDGLRCLIRHGDGVADPAPTSRLLQRLVHHPWTARTFRWIHPDLGLGLVERLARRLPGKHESNDRYERSAAAQLTYARTYLEEHPAVDLLVMGHTHRPALEQVAPRRWYVNPGAWMDGYRYAVVGPDGPELRKWEGGETFRRLDV